MLLVSRAICTSDDPVSSFFVPNSDTIFAFSSAVSDMIYLQYAYFISVEFPCIFTGSQIPNYSPMQTTRFGLSNPVLSNFPVPKNLRLVLKTRTIYASEQMGKLSFNMTG